MNRNNKKPGHSPNFLSDSHAFSRRCLSLLIINTIFFGCGQQPKGTHDNSLSTAIDYNNYIIERQKAVGEYITSFYNQLYTNQDSARRILQKASTTMETSLEDISKMPDFRGDSSFRHAAVNSFHFYVRLFEEDYPSILSIHSRNREMNDDDRKEEDKVLSKIIRDEDQVDKDLHNKQRDFADRFNMRLIKPAGEKDKD